MPFEYIKNIFYANTVRLTKTNNFKIIGRKMNQICYGSQNSAKPKTALVFCCSFSVFLKQEETICVPPKTKRKNLLNCSLFYQVKKSIWWIKIEVHQFGMFFNGKKSILKLWFVFANDGLNILCWLVNSTIRVAMR